MQATAEATAAGPAPAAIANPCDLFVKVPATTLPNGLVVPPFEVGQFLCSKGEDGLPAVTREGGPWVRIPYDQARRQCAAAGFTLLTETQALAIAHRIVNCPTNWSGGKVGEGEVYRGLHKWTVKSAQPGTYESADPQERRGFDLEPGGERLYDVAGNAYTWVFDDVQGDNDGLIATPFAKDSPSITAPYPPKEKGIGWYPTFDPDDEIDWSGGALVRGGCWLSESNAGVFYLYRGWPVYAGGYVGFRCTKPGL